MRFMGLRQLGIGLTRALRCKSNASVPVLMQWRVNANLEYRTRLFLTVVLFSLTYLIFSVSPIIDNSDSKYSILVSESILHNGTSHLNEYRFPAPIAELKTSTPPTVDPANPLTYELGKVNGNIVYCFPNGSSLLSLPFVAILNALSVHAASRDGVYNTTGEVVIEKTLSTLLMALLTCIVFRTALFLLNKEVSAVVALGFALGTQVWSTATRSLWSHTWFILLGGVTVEVILRAESQRRKIPPIFLATVLSWMYFVRPTGAIPIVCVAGYLFICHRDTFIAFAVTGALWFGAFIAYSWFTFGEPIPGYYLASRLNFHGFSTALAGTLISPSRGLLVYVPTIGFIFYLIARYWNELPYRGVVTLSLTIVALHIVSVAGYPNWWGGGSYGPRLTTDLLPWFALLAIVGCAGVKKGTGLTLSRPELGAAFALLALAVAINARGAFSVYAHHVWNLQTVIDRHPERAFDWSYPQFAAGLIAPPDYVTWRYPSQKQPWALEPAKRLTRIDGDGAVRR